MQNTIEAKIHKKGLRSVALFEAAKGLLVLALGMGLLSFLHRDIERTGVRIVHFFKLDPANHYPHIFLQALSHINNSNLVLMALGALAYSVLRLVEAYGLWHGKPWAEWLAIISGGLYLPVEFYELFRHLTAIKVLITIGNLFLLLYLLALRFPKQWHRFRDSCWRLLSGRPS